MEDTRRPIFIISNYRSGSTLLRFLLDAHPQVCCPAELRLGTLAQQLFNVAELLTADGSRADAWTGDRMHTRVGTVRTLIDSIMADYCRRRGKERWADKSPANCEVLHVLQAVFPDAHYICLHRHALDQIQSTFDLQGRWHVQPYLARYKGDVVAAAIDRWCTVTERILALEHAQNGRSLRITYEDFVEDSEREMERIMRFLEIASVRGLSQWAFQRPHDQGPADWKISGTSEVVRSRVGGGRGIGTEGVPAVLQTRLIGLLAHLGYSLA
jgi:protein-tyrosine sulfotransferase